MDNSAVHILTDEQLVKMAQEGSETAEEILIEKYKSLAKGKAKIYFIVGAEAEDVVQEGMSDSASLETFSRNRASVYS